MPRFFARHAATLFFPMALILYDFAAYLSTDLIQPGIINVVRDFNADVSLAPAAVSLYPVSYTHLLLLQNGADPEWIQKITGLSTEQMQALEQPLPEIKRDTWIEY